MLQALTLTQSLEYRKDKRPFHPNPTAADCCRIARQLCNTAPNPATMEVGRRADKKWLNFRPLPVICDFRHKNPRGIIVPGGLIYMPGSVLLSHGETPHYHRRYAFSLLSSRWDQVGPACYGRQANWQPGASGLQANSVVI